MDIETAAKFYNVTKADLEFLIENIGSPGASEMLEGKDDYDYFGSLAEHECCVSKLRKVSDATSLVSAVLDLRACGYRSTEAVKEVKKAAARVGDDGLNEHMLTINDQDELLDTIALYYGILNTFPLAIKMDGSALIRIPLDNSNPHETDA